MGTITKALSVHGIMCLFEILQIELRHNIRGDIMLYPGYIPNVEPCVLHYGLKFEIGDWHFSKAEW
jgi:hypothetical protein